jgi:hypothetical protein
MGIRYNNENKDIINKIRICPQNGDKVHTTKRIINPLASENIDKM